MKKVVLTSSIFVFLTSVSASAVVIDTVPVGDLGNLADTRYSSTGYGSVSYSYNIGKYEVTAAQYTEFLNNKAASDPYGLYNANMWTSTYGCKIQRLGVDGSYTYVVANDWASRPVNYVSFWDALRFTNWLHNGQGSGDTEKGAYIMNGYNGTDGRNIQRNPGAIWFLPSEDEWYKAAYYKSGGTNTGYWDYPTQNDTAPDNSVMPIDPGNNANYNNSIGSPYYRTIVGEFENSQSAYGTFDQGGNVAEFNETLFLFDGDPIAHRGLRGGAFIESNSNGLHAGNGSYLYDGPTGEYEDFGFRVAQIIPEPSTCLILALGGLLIRKRA
jgi:formylglycine-generating enzyme required for sulfatase activity